MITMAIVNHNFVEECNYQAVYGTLESPLDVTKIEGPLDVKKIKGLRISEL